MRTHRWRNRRNERPLQTRRLRPRRILRRRRRTQTSHRPHARRTRRHHPRTRKLRCPLQRLLTRPKRHQTRKTQTQQNIPRTRPNPNPRRHPPHPNKNLRRPHRQTPAIIQGEKSSLRHGPHHRRRAPRQPQPSPPKQCRRLNQKKHLENPTHLRFPSIKGQHRRSRNAQGLQHGHRLLPHRPPHLRQSCQKETRKRRPNRLHPRQNHQRHRQSPPPLIPKLLQAIPNYHKFKPTPGVPRSPNSCTIQSTPPD